MIEEEKMPETEQQLKIKNEMHGILIYIYIDVGHFPPPLKYSLTAVLLTH